MSEVTANTILLWITLAGTGGITIISGMLLYIAYTKMEIMLDCLKNCPAVMIRARFVHGGPRGRLFVLGGIYSVIKSPGLFLPDSGACAKDIENFPENLKNQLFFLYKTGNIIIGVLILSWLVLFVKWGSMPPGRLGVTLLTITMIPIWTLLCLRMKKLHGETIINNFKSSPAINIRKRLNTAGWSAQLMFIFALSIIITFSSFFTRRGTLKMEDLKNLSQHLRLKLFALFVLSAFLILSLFGLYFFHE